ncbi:hypothetical protein U9S86_004542 [Salmonella enterica]|nr:hypothetical protein [Salmonella enterica]EHA9546157.1 hypothetical protein [Salmonella enterica subsp. enterica serovar Braenderup]EBH4941539.1 hypothetical protein [Salmonella enterica]ECK3278463.1 hypothetical protein [Salmonella enterica]ECK6358131.1 hypothetical protein [Salmonella enterica]
MKTKRVRANKRFLSSQLKLAWADKLTLSMRLSLLHQLTKLKNNRRERRKYGERMDFYHPKNQQIDDWYTVALVSGRGKLLGFRTFMGKKEFDIALLTSLTPQRIVVSEERYDAFHEALKPHAGSLKDDV